MFFKVENSISKGCIAESSLLFYFNFSKTGLKCRLICCFFLHLKKIDDSLICILTYLQCKRREDQESLLIQSIIMMKTFFYAFKRNNNLKRSYKVIKT